jgi:DNA-directed RNA polymerase specialized sigma24 family protein
MPAAPPGEVVLLHEGVGPEVRDRVEVQLEELPSRHVEAILQHGLDRLPLAEAGEVPTARLVVHDQMRGPTYYQ